jgi:tRNA G10  N-methylase Trm11
MTRCKQRMDSFRGVQPYKLTARRYLGPTSMDTELAFVMCNLGQVRPHSLVYDPFAGTASVLVAAAAHGAVVLGADIDIRVIRDGKLDKTGSVVNAYSNFRDYGLPDPAGLLRMDAGNPAWRPGLEGVLDGLLCDPPYGVRAGGRTMLPRAQGALVKDKRCACSSALQPSGWFVLCTVPMLHISRVQPNNHWLSGLLVGDKSLQITHSCPQNLQPWFVRRCGSIGPCCSNLRDQCPSERLLRTRIAAQSFRR